MCQKSLVGVQKIILDESLFNSLLIYLIGSLAQRLRAWTLELDCLGGSESWLHYSLAE